MYALPQTQPQMFDQLEMSAHLLQMYDLQQTLGMYVHNVDDFVIAIDQPSPFLQMNHPMSDLPLVYNNPVRVHVINPQQDYENLEDHHEEEMRVGEMISLYVVLVDLAPGSEIQIETDLVVVVVAVVIDQVSFLFFSNRRK